MKYTYPVVFFKDRDGVTGVFPDLEYMAICADNLKEAVEVAAEYLEEHILDCMEEGIPMPEAMKSMQVDVEEIAEIVYCEGGTYTEAVVLDITAAIE